MPAYVGWVRQLGSSAGGRPAWRNVCQAPTSRECWELLERHPRSGACELTVLPQGQHPLRALRSPLPQATSRGRVARREKRR